MAVSKMAKGSQERKLKYAESQALRDASMRKAAATTAQVSEGQREQEYLESRAVALAAFQGGGVDDPSVQQLIADVSAEGEYRVLSKLYTGMGEAAGIQFASEQAMKAGDIALQRGYMEAIKTVLSSYGSFGAMGASAGAAFSGMGSKIGGMFSGKEALGMTSIYKPSPGIQRGAI
jgi:hypothetical protein